MRFAHALAVLLLAVTLGACASYETGGGRGCAMDDPQSVHETGPRPDKKGHLLTKLKFGCNDSNDQTVARGQIDQLVAGAWQLVCSDSWTFYGSESVGELTRYVNCVPCTSGTYRSWSRLESVKDGVRYTTDWLHSPTSEVACK